jgi:PilZ domain
MGMGYMTSQYRRVAPARMEEREAVRHPVMISRTTIRRHAAQADDAQLIDLSIYGCSLEADSLVKSGQRLWLRFSGGSPIASTVIWCEGGKLGCRFDSAIDRDLFRSLTLVTD